LPRTTYVSLKIFNSLGQEVAALISSIQQQGRHRAVWQADDLASGVYICRFQAGEFVQRRKLLFLQ